MTLPSDLDLLRRFEPIVRYTKGEYFFPMEVDPYIAECDLWAGSPNGERRMLVPRGELRVEALPLWQARVPDEALFLRFVQEPLSGIDLTRGDRPRRERFSAPSRLARVGILARLIDAGFDLSLLVRGTVPGGTVAAAEGKYARMRADDPSYCYYGRVIRQAGWTVCHYLFFYAMNDWRSSFAGANDHEADWEQCFVFLDTPDDDVATPVWFARAAHDEVGADLRRRWDDPLLQREGDHAVIFAGAGSHAAYIEPGEYLQAVPLQLPGWTRSLARGAREFWSGTLRQGTRARASDSEDFAAVPFVDYARGDGPAIGPGQAGAWKPVLIDDATPWVGGFDGLFGLDTKDRFAGEMAPAGPKFNRDGRPRQSWIDPVGFAGLQSVPPPSKEAGVLADQAAVLRSELVAVVGGISETEARAQRHGIRVEASRRAGRSEPVVEGAQAELATTVEELSGLRRRAEDLRVITADIDAELQRVERGEPGDPRAHLRFVAHPQDPSLSQRSRVLDIWSAVGIATAIVLLGALLIAGVEWWWVALPVILAGYVAIEALVRRRFLILLLDVTVLLAVIAALILIETYLLEGIAVLLLAIGILILRDNVRELRSSARRA
ncbi:MAG: hypothetical protein MUQ32_04895 [Chloroflexi bacterium]|nr:hypothetical protein [Chloroflexota bacterium]